MEKRKLVVNLFGGPGTGKSTNMAGVFHLLKKADIDCEMVPEFAKDKVWEESYRVLDNQIYVFGKQYHRLARVVDKVDVAVTDSPILLSIYYDTHYLTVPPFEHFPALILEAHNRMNTLNIFLVRKKKYNPNGRYQTEEQAKDIDVEVLGMLEKYDIPYVQVVADSTAPQVIFDLIQQRPYLRYNHIWVHGRKKYTVIRGGVEIDEFDDDDDAYVKYGPMEMMN